MEFAATGIILSLLFSAFFSGTEIAFISSNRLKIELDRTKGSLSGRILGFFYKKEGDFIAMLLLGNNIALVFFGLFSAVVLDPYIEHWGIEDEALTLLLQTLISTIVVLIVAEFLPKALFQLNPNVLIKYTAFPMIIIYGILYVPTVGIVAISNGFLRLLRVENGNQKKVFSKVDLEHYVQDMNRRINDEQELGNEIQILQNALDFDSLKARDCMVPRIDLEAVELDDPLDKLKERFIETGYSKILVYKDNIDNIIGYVHSFEMFKNPASIKQILLPIAFVPEASSGMQLLKLFTENSGNIAVVVDEYGGTAGVVTIEDVIEEIFGEIEDEHDDEGLLEEELGEGDYLFSARLEIDYLNETYDLNLEESEEYETLGGLVIHYLEEIPKSGATMEINDISLTVESVSQNRIETIRVTK
jgi:CBS domain containing-hemolysin-like protein